MAPLAMTGQWALEWVFKWLCKGNATTFNIKISKNSFGVLRNAGTITGRLFK